MHDSRIDDLPGVAPPTLDDPDPTSEGPVVRHALRPPDRRIQEPAREGPAFRGRRHGARDPIALLEADVALPVVKEFVAAVKERARGEEVSGALNPAQQIVKIVNEEPRRTSSVARPAGCGSPSQARPSSCSPVAGSGKTILAAKLGLWLKEQGRTPMLVAADLQRPNAVNQPGQRRAGRRTRLRAVTGQRRGRPRRRRPRVDRGGQAQAARRGHRRHRRPPRRRRRDDGPGRRDPRRRPA